MQRVAVFERECLGTVGNDLDIDVKGVTRKGKVTHEEWKKKDEKKKRFQSFLLLFFYIFQTQRIRRID